MLLYGLCGFVMPLLIFFYIVVTNKFTKTNVITTGLLTGPPVQNLYCNTFTSQVIDIRLTVFDLNIRPSNRNVPLGLRQRFRLWIKQIMLPSYPVNNCIINLKHRF